MLQRYRVPDETVSYPGPLAMGMQETLVGPRRQPGQPGRPLTKSQVAAIRAAMQLFVEDDLAKGITADRRLYCDACQGVRAAAGFIQYNRYQVCNACAIEFEIAHARGVAASPGQFVRDKNFGESSRYALDGV